MLAFLKDKFPKYFHCLKIRSAVSSALAALAEEKAENIQCSGRGMEKWIERRKI